MINIFIDECGTPNLNAREPKDQWYILAAVIVDDSQLLPVRLAINEYSRRHGGGGEIKSKNHNTPQRVRKFFDQINGLSYNSYILAVDKKKIKNTSGLKWRSSFVKFCSSLMYTKLLKSFPDLRIFADEYGRKEFMNQFRSYILDKQPILYSEQTFQFVKSHLEPIVQLADMVAGTANKILTNQIQASDLPSFTGHELIFERWPPFETAVIRDSAIIPQAERFDWRIQEYCFGLATEYLRNNEESANRNQKARISILRYLLVHAYDPECDFIHADVIMRHLQVLGVDIESKHAFMSHVGKLRDANVIIATCEDGYRIPTKLSDMILFVGTVGSKVLPYIKRLKTARDSIRLMTNGMLDIVERYPNESLVKMITAI